MPPLQAPNSQQPTISQPMMQPRTPEQQSWGTIIAIIIIVAMIVVGALYAWGKRIAEENALLEQVKSQTQTY